MFTRVARSAWAILTWLVLAMLPVQFYFAGVGAFRYGDSPAHSRDYYWMLHAVFGTFIGLAVILVLLAGLASRLPSRLTGMTVGLFVLMVIQFILPGLGDSSPWIAALHPLNALLITGLTISMAIRARAYLPFARFRPTGSQDLGSGYERETVPMR
jgi:hypothetical protein